ncbi:hypothetical protein GCM10011613_14500 [Cellvibrio zantedeschiae]|uniref:Nucleotidyltransferase family protein n=1 Tax=Cellvibrio zantedeschiae TaxID=1237077 RepID=A0ABQ3AXP3_9GAMM|nr:nucleotidyltransferase family protein [Cellvibrio zantedeschiae]GGY71047.1 hypothetical protein GCM10011613_14500 [Cellvibrio zantedeschiae]
MYSERELQKQLIDIAQSSDWFMQALSAAEQLGLESWCIGAGAVRNLVWDYLHGYTKPSELPYLDVVYFDSENLSAEREKELQQKLSQINPNQMGASKSGSSSCMA